MSEHIEELQDWLADLHQLVSSKTTQKEIEYAKKRIDSLEFLMEQNNRYREAIERAINEGVTIEDCNEAVDHIYGILGEALEESE